MFAHSKNHSSILPSIILATIVSTFPRTSAQLVGCDAVGCPVGENHMAQCTVGNATMMAVGVAPMNTSISSEPFTWTLGIQKQPNPENGTEFLYTRNYFLGTPPSPEINSSSSIPGCALFFEGISQHLSFPETDFQYATGTCSDALGSSCLNDLLSQAQAETNSMASQYANETTFSACSALENAIQSNIPQSCLVARNQTWGKILVREFPGIKMKTDQDNCHPTTGQDYDLSLVSTYQETAVSSYVELKPVLGAITPVMTIILPGSSSLNLTLENPEVNLNCLKIIASDEGQTIDVASKAAKVLGGSCILSFFAVVATVLVVY